MVPLWTHHEHFGQNSFFVGITRNTLSVFVAEGGISHESTDEISQPFLFSLKSVIAPTLTVELHGERKGEVLM